MLVTSGLSLVETLDWGQRFSGPIAIHALRYERKLQASSANCARHALSIETILPTLSAV